MNKKTERKENLRLIIDTLRLSGPLAQARLKESCSLQASTVSYLVNDLRMCNLVVDIGKEDTQGRVGKPGNTISLNNEKAQFLGVYVEDDCLHAYLIGIDGKTLGYEYVEYTPSDVEKMIFAIIKAVFRGSEYRASDTRMPFDGTNLDETRERNKLETTKHFDSLEQ